LPDIEWNSAAHLVTGAKLGAARRLFDLEHQADRGSGRVRADHDQTIVEDFKATFS